MNFSQLEAIQASEETIFTKSFEFEKFEINWWRKYIAEQWAVSLYVIGIYIAFIYFGQKIMEKRKAFDLKQHLIVWNTGLALFSIFGFFRILPEFIYNFKIGVHYSVCERADPHSYSTAFWGFLFMASKIIELGDTVFIVLRKKPLIFLHYYHHITVLYYCWNFFPQYEPAVAWFCIVNYFVHSVMYGYFGLRALGVKIPKKLSMTITMLQIFQMAVGLGICFYSLAARTLGYGCLNQNQGIYLGIGMYFSYLILFAQYFQKAYGGKKKLA